jgi:hypothetical protein
VTSRPPQKNRASPAKKTGGAADLAGIVAKKTNWIGHLDGFRPVLARHKPETGLTGKWTP